ncbi:hypothetical protein [Streptomyces sp. RTGN2]|uniref:hypothetical protein n=1 Tax=Streptomyces sp. RTGN2 TaxID=3016525 RepID=UPI002553DFBC|nr:hypothetical protein [Streptomyces sp. RTGN2]
MQPDATAPPSPNATEKAFLLAVLTRVTGSQVSLSIHAPHCPVFPVNGKTVVSSGTWTTSEALGSRVVCLVAEARQRGVPVRASCRRCGGWSA